MSSTISRKYLATNHILLKQINTGVKFNLCSINVRKKYGQAIRNHGKYDFESSYAKVQNSIHDNL